MSSMDTAWACRVLDNGRIEVLPTADPGAVAEAVPPGFKVAVTCSPRLGVDPTVELAGELRRRGLSVVPHISARGVSGPGHLERVARRLAESGIDEVFVVGGDADRPAGEYSSAAELLDALVSAVGRTFTIGVAAYPEGHPRIPAHVLVAALLAKQRYASYAVMQICFNSAAILRWIDDARAAGLAVPLYLCLPGRVRLDRLVRIAMRLGLGPSLRYLEKQKALLPVLLTGGALYDPWATIEELAGSPGDARRWVVGIQWSTFNEVAATVRWVERKRRELECAAVGVATTGGRIGGSGAAAAADLGDRQGSGPARGGP